MGMNKIKTSDSPLMKQYKRWARSLLKVNPSYVTCPDNIVWYVKGPNWDEPHWEYAHYKDRISCYGKELLAEFEKMRALPQNEACDVYRAMMKEAGVEETNG